MLEFLKKIFKNEEQEQKQAHEISLHNAKEWLGEKAKPLSEEIRQNTESILMKVDEEAQKTRFNLEVLENAKLQNPNIPFRAKQYMEGNRKAYIKSVNSFLGHMEINNKDYFYLLEFCKKFDDLLDELNKGTIRSYMILQEFFANETGKIAMNLKNFDSLFRQLKSVLKDEKMVAVNGMKERAAELESKTKQRINIDIDLKNAEASVKIAGSEKDSIMESIAKFSQSEEHNNFIRLKEERKSKEKAFYEKQDIVLQSFAVLDRPLRKYSHIAFEHEEIVLDYLKDPIGALADDKEMKLASILANLEKMLQENKIQIDDRKKEKTIEEIKKLSREFITDFVKNHNSFRSEIEELDNKIKATGVNEKMKEFNRKLEETNLRIEKNSVEYGKLKEDLARIDNSIAKLKNDIEGSARNAFGEEIRISF